MREHLRGECFYASWIQKQKERLDAKISGAPDPHPELEINFLDEVVVNLVFIHITFAFTPTFAKHHSNFVSVLQVLNFIFSTYVLLLSSPHRFNPLLS